MADKIGPLSLLLITVLIALALLPLQSSTDVGFDRKPLADDQSETELLTALGRLNPVLTPDMSPVVAAPKKDNFPPPINYVFWLNVSGFRGDYVEGANARFFAGLAGQSHATARLSPTFPALHWPSLVSQATGLEPTVHGILSETIRNPANGEIVKRPTDLSFLKGEPIWTTAKRQGIRVLVHDWPFSQTQPAENAADVFLPEFDETLSDDDRLNALLDAWTTNGSGEEKIRLVMASVNDVEKAGETFGPRAPEMLEAFGKFDQRLEAFFGQLTEKWKDLNRGGDVLWVIISTDHGMAELTTLVNFEEFVSEQSRGWLVSAVDDTVAHLWLNVPDGTDVAKATAALDEELGKPIFWKVYKPEEVPAHWNYPPPGPLMGDRIIALQPGYRFTDKKGAEPVYPATEAEGGPLSTGGYAVSSSSRMRGQLYIFQYPERGLGSDLERIDAIQIYPTICKLLGIEPAEGVASAALDLGAAPKPPDADPAPGDQ